MKKIIRLSESELVRIIEQAILNGNSISVEPEEKSEETYEFIKNYLDVIDFNDYVNNPNLYQVVARKGGDIIGVRVFRMKDGKLHLNYTAVSPLERNLGVNKLMLGEIEKIAKNNGVQVITSNVRESNLSSLNSLLNSGFQINKNYELYYPDGERKLPLFKKL